MGRELSYEELQDVEREEVLSTDTESAFHMEKCREPVLMGTMHMTTAPLCSLNLQE